MSGRGGGRGRGRGRGRGGRSNSFNRQSSQGGRPGPSQGATASGTGGSSTQQEPGQGRGTLRRSQRNTRRQQSTPQEPPAVEGPLGTPYRRHSQAKPQTRPTPAESVSSGTPITTPVSQPKAEAQPKATPSESRPKASQPKTKPPKGKAGPGTEPTNHWGRKQPPDRPGFGTVGKKIMVRANFFPVRFPRHVTAHQYDVTFLPDGKYPKWLLRSFVEELEKRYGGDVLGGKRVAFDGRKNIYTSQHINLGGKEKVELKIEHTEDGKQREITIVIKYATSINVDMERVEQLMRDVSDRTSFTQAVDIIMGHLPSLRTQPVGRSFFSRPPLANLSGGVEVWGGYYQSLRPTMGWKFMLNLDVSATAFYTEQSVIDFMVTILRGGFGREAVRELTDGDRAQYTRRSLEDRDRRTFEDAIKGLKIQVTHLPYPRKYKVNGVTRQSAERQTFELDGRQCSVANYFSTQYKTVLRFPHLPCLHCGDPKKSIYIPLELCLIVGGQRCAKKLNEQQTSNMIRAVTKPADERERQIREKFHASGINKDPVLRDFGISVSDQMAVVPARVLDPPALGYAHSESMKPPRDRGAWDIRGKKFYQRAVVEGYAVLLLTRRVKDFELRKFLDMLVKAGGECGIEFRGSPDIRDVGPRDSLERIFTDLKKKSVNLIIAIIDNPRRGEPSKYNEIKRVGDTTASGIATQCVKSDTVTRKCNPQTCVNICLKINPKLGGINNTIVSRPKLLKDEPVIVFGADVTHPKAGDTTTPSIAAVVATTDPSATIFKGKHNVQQHRVEIIANLKDMAKELLMDFRRNSGHKPTRIIFYRDGVSEGQFNDVRVAEIGALQKACLELEPSGDYQPGITFLVVQKRHHTRFVPVDRRDADRKTGNVPPGTIVEHEITHPHEFDFYLCSQAAIQGTSRPCHYHVLWDDNDFSPDDLQTFSYQLCHTFWRCTRSVSYPSPAYYAHRVAAHAKVLLQANQDLRTGPRDPGVEEMDRLIAIHRDRSGFMYFM